MPNRQKYFPSLARIYNSFRLRIKEFLRENTLHGFPYFVDPSRPLWERIAWFICTIASIMGAIGIIITILLKFRSDPILTRLDTQTDDLVTYFPSVSLCEENPHFNFGHYESDREHYSTMYKWAWEELKDPPSKELRNETYSSLYLRTSVNCEDLYTDCVAYGKSVSCGDIFKKIIGTRGVCCFVEGMKISKQSKMWGLSFMTKALPARVDVLEHNVSPAQRHGSYWYDIKTGVSVEISLSLTYATVEVHGLSRQERKCLLPDEDTSYDRCLYRCHTEFIQKICDCLPWFLSSSGHYRECKRHEYNCLVANATILREPPSDCDCYLACNYTAYDTKKLEYRADDKFEIKMLNWPSLLYKRDVRNTWLDLVVSFGGIAGLFVGYSLLTTVELAYYLSLRPYCGAVLAEPEKTIKIKVAMSRGTKKRVVSVIDLEKRYFDYVN